MTSVFLLTSVAHAEDSHYKAAQDFFVQRNLAQKKGGATYFKPSQKRSTRQAKTRAGNSTPLASAVYLSLINEKYGSLNSTGPDVRTSLGLSIPILNASSGKTSGEFSISGDIRNASEWGRFRILHRESIDVIRWNDTQLQLFIGAGLGYGYGDLVNKDHRLFAPWKAGAFFNQIHKNQPVFYRFEFGFTGDIAFSDQSYKSGFFANLSLGYKL